MWWSPDSRKLAYYRFDEKQVPDYYLQLDQTQIQSTVDVEAYPEGRRAEPDRRSVRLRRRDEEDARRSTSATASRSTTSVVGHYVYRVSWSPDGTRAALQPHQPPAEHPGVRRRQSRRPARRASIIREEWPTGWVENRPPMQFLKDGRRFIWESERNGWTNFYLYDLQRQADRAADHAHARSRSPALVKVDEAAGVALLHGARRRQLPEAAAASRRPRRQGRRAADRSGVQPHGRRLHGAAPAAAAAAALAAPRPCGISPDNKLLRRRLSDARHAAGDAAGRRAPARSSPSSRRAT